MEAGNDVTTGQSRAFLPTARNFTCAAAVALFVLLCVLPTLYMIGASLISADGRFTFANYSRLFIEPRQRQLLTTTALLGAGVAIAATLIGAPLGLLLARADLPMKRLLRFALVIPLVIPPYILALAWIYVGGPAGLVAQAVGRDLLSGYTYSLTGAIIVLGINFFPLSMLATEAAARRVDGRLEEAALLVARPRRVLWRITLPLIAPGITAAALIIFVLAISELGVPGLLRIRVYTTEIFTAFAALYDFGAATSLSTPLLVLAIIVGVFAKVMIGDRHLTTRRSLRRGLPLGFGPWRILALVGVGLVIAIAVLLPITVLVLEARGVERIWVAAQSSRMAITNSILLAAVGATIIVALAVLLGYFRGRAQSLLGSISELIFIMIFAVPSTVVGIGLIALWNRPGIAGFVYTSPAIILIGYLARFVPVAALILAPSIRQIPVSSEEAAMVSGAGWSRTFRRIILPQARASLVAAWVVTFIFAFSELGMTVLVAPPGESTLPVRIYTLIANSPASDIAALALMQASIILMPLAALTLFARSERRNL
jgi:iron(III) transport system permease protein